MRAHAGPMRAHAGPCGPSQHRELACRLLRSAPAAYYLEAHEARQAASGSRGATRKRRQALAVE